jgi:hypothetical protein
MATESDAAADVYVSPIAESSGRNVWLEVRGSVAV